MNNRIRLTKRFTFEAAHTLNNHDGDCKYIHGHSYKLYVTVIGTPIDNEEDSKNGMVIDFKDLKSLVKEYIIDKYDHALLLNSNNQSRLINTLNSNMKIVIVNFQTTCENMLAHFANTLMSKLTEKNIQLFSIKLYETESSYAEWYLSDQQ